MTQIYGLRCDADHCTHEIGTFTEPAEAARKALKAGWTVGEDESGYDTDFCPLHGKIEVRPKSKSPGDYGVKS